MLSIPHPRLGLAAVALTAGAIASSFAQAQATLETLASFDEASGRLPRGVTLGPDGALYGLTQAGGANDEGAIFRFDPASNELTLLHSFDGASGRSPLGRLTLHPNGWMYGTTWRGGATNQGTLFRIHPSTNVFELLISLSDTTGIWPWSGVVVGEDDALFGTTQFGGANNMGTVYKYDPISGVLTTLVSFNGANGRSPYAELTPDSTGLLYGTTYGGGANLNCTNGCGTLFRVNPTTGSLMTLASFGSGNGSLPTAQALFDSRGILYGTTYVHSGGGTVFRYNPPDGPVTTVANFHSGIGTSPGPMIADGAGNLFGLAASGGNYVRGVVFRFSTSSGALMPLYSFEGPDGSGPTGLLIPDSEGNLIGVTSRGGDHGWGTIFRLSNAGFVLPEPCPGDTNGDNQVNFTDLNAVLSDFGASGADLPADVSADGVVNFTDLNIVLSEFATPCD